MIKRILYSALISAGILLGLGALWFIVYLMDNDMYIQAIFASFIYITIIGSLLLEDEDIQNPPL